VIERFVSRYGNAKIAQGEGFALACAMGGPQNGLSGRLRPVLFNTAQIMAPYEGQL
jgi:hypothetical protein